MPHKKKQRSLYDIQAEINRTSFLLTGSSKGSEDLKLKLRSLVKERARLLGQDLSDFLSGSHFERKKT